MTLGVAEDETLIWNYVVFLGLVRLAWWTVLGWHITAYFFSQNTIHSNSRALFILPTEQARWARASHDPPWGDTGTRTAPPLFRFEDRRRKELIGARALWLSKLLSIGEATGLLPCHLHGLAANKLDETSVRRFEWASGKKRCFPLPLRVV